jgi:hypothetical protein
VWTPVVNSAEEVREKNASGFSPGHLHRHQVSAKWYLYELCDWRPVMEVQAFIELGVEP